MDAELVQNVFPAVDTAGRVMTVLTFLDRHQVQDFERCLVGREMASPDGGLPEPRVQRLRQSHLSNSGERTALETPAWWQRIATETPIDSILYTFNQYFTSARVLWGSVTKSSNRTGKTRLLSLSISSSAAPTRDFC